MYNNQGFFNYTLFLKRSFLSFLTNDQIHTQSDRWYKNRFAIPPLSLDDKSWKLKNSTLAVYVNRMTINFCWLDRIIFIGVICLFRVRLYLEYSQPVMFLESKDIYSNIIKWCTLTLKQNKFMIDFINYSKNTNVLWNP